MRKSYINLRRASKDDIEVINEILTSAPKYFRNIQGTPPDEKSGLEVLETLPPKCSLNQKYVFLLESGTRVIGVADVILGYPDIDTAFIGLVLLTEKLQGLGFGKLAYQEIENFIVTKNFNRIRLGIVESNPVVDFWKKQGFIDLKETKPYECKEVKSTVHIFEKKLM